MAKLKGLSMENMIMIVAFAMLGLYLFSQFTATNYKCTQDDIDDENYGCEGHAVGYVVEHRYFKMPVPSPPENPTGLDTPVLGMINFIVVGLALTLAYGIIMKVAGKSMSSRDIASLIIMAVIVVLAYKYFLKPMLDWKTLDDISWNLAMKLGLL